MKINKKLFICLLTLLFPALCLFCNWQTHGFRLHLILSNLPNDPRWEAPSLSPQEQKEVNRRLNQSFTFLGAGGWCFAFLGEDQTTVLKFYKHTHLSLETILREHSFGKLFFKSPPWPEGEPYFQEGNFISCLLLHNQIKERTGLLYVHINKTQDLLPKETLIKDPSGVRLNIDLNRTEFVLQTRVDPILHHLDTLLKKGQIETAKSRIREMLLFLDELYTKGIADGDPSFRRNFGYIGEKAVTLDLSSFDLAPCLKEKKDHTQEILIKTKRLQHYLKKHYPDLFLCYQQYINEISEHSL